MNSSKNYTEVLIGGKIYVLGGAEEEEYFQKVAAHINATLAELNKQDGFQKQTPDYQNIMLAINLCDDYFKAKKALEEAENALSTMERELYNTRHELVVAQMKKV